MLLAHPPLFHLADALTAVVVAGLLGWCIPWPFSLWANAPISGRK